MKRLVAAAALVGLASVPLATSLISAASSTFTSQTSTTTPPTAPEAARFLTQATFGPTDQSIASVQTSGIAPWIAQQESMPVSNSHVAYMDNRLAFLRLTNSFAQVKAVDFYNSFWKASVVAPDQLRQRVKLALSEIFVISFAAPEMSPRGIASYYDMLGTNSFGNYRAILEKVTLHPMMGNYLNMIHSAKENLATGQHPDENFAREVQQLMSIGLYQLNQDGTVKTDAAGAPIPTYTISDIEGLAKVFTGFSWYVTDPTVAGTLVAFQGSHLDANSYVTSMVAYPAYHSTSAKSFLGVTIPASTKSDPNGDLKIALDTIFNHPNVGPFIGKQLIQRLVTSNPSPAYVSRVAGVFNDNGAGVRGDMRAVIAAILTDPEARTQVASSSPTYGKLREPVVRLANWARAFKATSTSNWWLIGDTSAPVSLYQSALNAPSVFNFWRPGFVPPGTAMGAQGLVAPEFQAVNEVTVAGYPNVMLKTVYAGIGPTASSTNRPDVRSTFDKEKLLANDAGKLADRVNLLLLYGQMSPLLRSRIVGAVNAIAVPGSTATQGQIDKALANRAHIAVFLATISPEYLAQR